MQKKPVLTATQLTLMSVGSAMVFPYTFMPILNAPPANQDVWIVLLLTFAYILLLNLPLLFLMHKFRGINVCEATELMMGKVFGKVVLAPVVLFCLFCHIACMLITGIFISIYIFPNTPIWALLIFMVVPVSYAVFKGAGTIGRLSTFIVPFALFSVVLFFVFSIPEMDFNEFQPILVESTFLQINFGAFLTAARYSEILIFWVFSYYLMQKSSIKKPYAATLLIFAFSFFLILIPTVTVLGLEYAQHAWNPYYTFTRQIEVLAFLERMQAINLMAWFPCALLKLALYNYMTCHILSGIFRTKSYKSLIIPVSAVSYIVCLLPFMNKASTIEQLRSDQVFPFFILPTIFVIPLILLIVYLIRKKRVNRLLSQRKSQAATTPSSVNNS
ncbi:MAG: GerAB/ArcD/ProY family transporter [Christensenellales bacterium]|jgi:spore germination protein KB